MNVAPIASDIGRFIDHDAFLASCLFLQIKLGLSSEDAVYRMASQVGNRDKKYVLSFQLSALEDYHTGKIILSTAFQRVYGIYRI